MERGILVFTVTVYNIFDIPSSLRVKKIDPIPTCNSLLGCKPRNNYWEASP